MPQPKIPRWIGWPLLAVWTFVVLSFFAKKATFHPSKYPEGLWDIQTQLGAEDVWLETSDGLQIHGWMLRGTPNSPWMTLFLHGNAGNLTHRIGHFEAIGSAGSDLFIIDYRGYGRSEGSPSEEGTYRDAEAAYKYLLEEGYEAEQIILHGESLGTAMAVDLASRRACAGLILEAPFPSARAVAQRVLPIVGPLVTSGLETARKIPQVRAPVLIIHGDRDEVIAYDLGQQVYHAAREPKQFWTVEGAGHNNLLGVAGSRYVERLREFYATLRPQ